VSGYTLAHLNVARMRAPMDSPLMAGFVAQLESINALADASPGFIWRLKDEDPNDPGVRALGEGTLINLSVWRDSPSLADFVYRSAHAGVMRRRREWFAHLDESYVVLWWVAAGDVPTILEAASRLELLRAKGASAQGFTFRNPFPPPDQAYCGLSVT
jgi:hypothetical protein